MFDFFGEIGPSKHRIGRKNRKHAQGTVKREVTSEDLVLKGDKTRDL